MDGKWNHRFLRLAAHIAAWSKDPSTKCGAVIVRPDKTIASTGFNGFPKGCNDEKELYNDRELKYARVIHAEQNAILHSSEKLNGYTIYVYPASKSGSCDRCAAHIIQAGIKEIVFYSGDFAEGRWREAEERAIQMYKEADVKMTPVVPPFQPGGYINYPWYYTTTRWLTQIR